MIVLLILVKYDVVTKTAAGRKRLRKVAKECENYGMRVQNSVFECVVDAAQFKQLKLSLIDLINESEDSLRFYQLGNNYKTKVEHVGAKEAIEVEEVLIL